MTVSRIKQSKMNYRNLIRLPWEPKLPFVDLNLLQMNLRGERTSAAHENLWNLAVLTTQTRENK